MWASLLRYVVFQFLAALLTPRPRVNQQNARAATEDQIRRPDSAGGNSIPVLFGTKNIKSGQLMQAGNFKAVPIKEKVSGGGKGGK